MSERLRPDQGNTSASGTSGWSSFEARIRERRFSRCLQRATDALNAGNTVEAGTAIDEARELFPYAAEIAQFERRLLERAAAETRLILSPTVDKSAAEPERAARIEAERAARDDRQATSPLLFADFGPREPVAQPVAAKSGVDAVRAIGAVAALLVCAVGGFYFAERYMTSPAQDTETASAQPPLQVVADMQRPAADVARAPVANTPPAAAAASAPALPTQERIEAQFETPKAVKQSTVIESTASNPPRRDRIAASSDTNRNTKTAASAPAPVRHWQLRPLPEVSNVDAGANTPSVIPAVNTTAAAPEPTPVLSTAATSSATPAGPEPIAPVSLPVADKARASSRAMDADQIKAVLARYELAYNRLDARAASDVWPTVDSAALSRAFKDLLSQKVALGLCDITVIGDIGGASCAGRARWEPRVGGGMQTAERYWKFDLRRSDGNWKIEQIRVR
jgi:hypothetical protein